MGNLTYFFLQENLIETIKQGFVKIPLYLVVTFTESLISILVLIGMQFLYQKKQFL